MSKSIQVMLTLVLLISLLAFGAAPKAISLAIDENALDELIALLPTGPDLELEVEKGQLSKGWFGSKGTLNLTYTIAELEPIRIHLDFDISHGPLLVTADGVAFGFAHANVYPQISFNNSPLDLTESALQIDANLTVLADFRRALKAEFSVNPLSENSANQTITFTGLRGSVLVRADQSADAVLTLDSFSFADAPNDQRIDIKNASLRARTESLNLASAPAAIELNFPSISSDRPSPLSIEDLSFTSSISKQTSTKRIALRQGAKLGAATGNTPVTSGQWHIEISDIEEETLTNFYALLSRLQSLQNATSTSAAREANELYQRIGLLLLNNSLTLSSEFNVNAYDGIHSAELRLAFKGLPQLRNIMALNINEAIAASSFSADADLDLEAISRSPAQDMIDPMVRDGYIVINNGRIKLNAKLQDSIIELNGQATPVERFF